ncbi:hypothetical protein COX64_04770 [Candidatus Dojkabacteria bacterium CG_4_10_14_0_2_um_filter_Dojkabacteria_WS6_41_15]|uniref:Nudix hydrolase domain-containing protein n=1 Tax=Candidatus Dojkabacteria bacterium CG_4_10_14_0_2_um_filter_Dojkabacteria_WS6_41_15 TaxID=2014249 RepID=A0A2M7W1H5_9BACT|nr:MAG: hypothetical protein COX64_04770 [Candidatus Dojkabacteria bacterium CG_4_10_14_0_2_um_filter_Dojkabacteria_WS6_41_15]
MKNPNYNVTKEQHLKELKTRIPPILNVDIIIRKGELLLIARHKDSLTNPKEPKWMFPGSRMHWDETPQETALRVLANEVPGVTASLKKLVSVVSDKGWDNRANGIYIYYVFDYISGEPKANVQMIDFKWVTHQEFTSADDIYSIDQNLAKELDVAIRGINISEDEVLTEVNKDDEEIGKIIKKEAHSSNKRFHRAAHLMIFTSKGEVILQQRSWNKMSGPGKWDMPGGHQVLGQTIEQCAASELAEEMGISIDLTFVRKGLYQDTNQSEYYYLYAGISDGPYGFDKNEVEQIKVFDCKKLLLKEYEEAPQVLDHVFGYIKELRPFWEPLTKSVAINS